MSSNQSDVSIPPEPIASDYVEMITLVIHFIVGAPINLAAYTQLSERPTSTRLDLLKRSLNYSDLLILFIFVPSRACWLLTYDWRGGDSLCKFVKMMHTFAFQSSSNVIVCIAVDRLLSVLSSSHHSPTRALRRTKMMLIVAWVVAFIISCPQLYFWQDYLALPEYNWSQCLSIWDIARYEHSTNPNPSSNSTSLSADDFNSEFLYSFLHIALVFWIPAMIIILSYIIVLSWVWINSRPSIRTSHGSISFHTGCDTVDTVLSRASEWNPLKNFVSTRPNNNNNKEFGGGYDESSPRKVQFSGVASSATPRIIVSDETSQPLTQVPQRPSLSPSEASAVMRNGVHTSTSYNANLNRSRALRVSLLLVVAYIICWFPYNLFSLIQILDPQLFKTQFAYFHFAQQLIILNSVVNPYLYGFFGPMRPRYY
ncbi:unnamed protein product [Caenorhabditis angaria]|uniref:G-protein coupled receptors family 1 profile domain-containing protein n=1 Tax=Caenorhabditis angaria TaxID=860376 RepID=A0A9P1IML7_9PELO|nr:unnamed protein product [Caenorhabditis angaria]